MQLFTKKKDFLDVVGSWEFLKTSAYYELGSNQITLVYNNKEVTFQNDNILTVAFYAAQFNAINKEQYSKLFNEICEKQERENNQNIHI